MPLIQRWTHHSPPQAAPSWRRPHLPRHHRNRRWNQGNIPLNVVSSDVPAASSVCTAILTCFFLVLSTAPSTAVPVLKTPSPSLKRSVSFPQPAGTAEKHVLDLEILANLGWPTPPCASCLGILAKHTLSDFCHMCCIYVILLFFQVWVNFTFVICQYAICLLCVFVQKSYFPQNQS